MGSEMCIRDRCPHHGVPNWLPIQTFYNGLEWSVKISVDAAAGGALMGKSIEATKALLEEMASNNHHWASERAAPKRGSGRYEIGVRLVGSEMCIRDSCNRGRSNGQVD